MNFGFNAFGEAGFGEIRLAGWSTLVVDLDLVIGNPLVIDLDLAVSNPLVVNLDLPINVLQTLIIDLDLPFRSTQMLVADLDLAIAVPQFKTLIIDLDLAIAVPASLESVVFENETPQTPKFGQWIP